jgi:hypothetical protein
LKRRPHIGKALRMHEDARKNMSRDERLAAKLRENLRRRKAQARAMSDSEPAGATESLPNPSGES